MLKHITLIVIYTFLFSCYSTKHISEEEYILKKNTIVINNDKNGGVDGLLKQDINAIIKQKPNKKIIGIFPFHLWVYNISKPHKDNWVNNYLRKIGEKPVILSNNLIKKSTSQIKSYFDNNGYFTSNVTSNIIYKKKYAYVNYNIQSGKLYLINNIKYPQKANPDIYNLIISNLDNSEIQEGDVFTYSSLNNERIRLANLLQDNGYYRISKEALYIKADSTDNKLVNIEFFFKNKTEKNIYNTFHINRIYIHLENNNTKEATDTILYQNKYYFIKNTNDKYPLRKDVIAELIKINAGAKYSKKNAENTHQNLSHLAFFKKIAIEFIEIEDKHQLNCHIYMANPTKMYYSFEAEVKRSSDEGNVGISGYFQFGNKNLFRGAENLNSKIKVSLGNRQASLNNNDELFNTKEISYEIGLKKPKIILPKGLQKWIKNSFQMNTNFIFSVTKRERPDFSSQTITQKLGYHWRNSDYTQHQLNLIELSFLDIKENDFISSLIENNIYLQEQFEDKFIPATNYTFLFNNQRQYKILNYMFLKTKIETSGNLFQLLGQTRNFQKNENDDYVVFNNTFSQYVRFDIDLRKYIVFSKENTLVLRGFLGAGYAYGNSEKLPIQKQFFSGGVNSIRAWEAFGLGPGSSTSENNYATGDFKIEFNIEYRFPFLNSLKSALFIDGGNIWSIKENPIEGSTFKIKNLLEEIALGVGFGFRYDLDFLIIRLDLARPLKDPSKSIGDQWISNPLNGKFRYNLAIGYPF